MKYVAVAVLPLFLISLINFKLRVRAIPSMQGVKLVVWLHFYKEAEIRLAETMIPFRKKESKKEKKASEIKKAIFAYPGSLRPAVNAKIVIIYGAEPSRPLPVLALVCAAAAIVSRQVQYLSARFTVTTVRKHDSAHNELSAEGIFTIRLIHIIFDSIKYALRKVIKNAGASAL